MLARCANASSAVQLLKSDLLAADFRRRAELDLETEPDPVPQGRWRLEDQRGQECVACRLLRLLHHRLHRSLEGIEPRHEDTVLFVVHKDAPGLSVKGEWDPLGMRGTNSRDLILKDVFVTADDMLMPPGIFGKTLPNWPHMMATLSPTYMGLAQGAYDFMVDYLKGKTPGQAAD